MLDYDCPRSALDKATSITPGLESPTIAPLADPDWVAIRHLYLAGVSTRSWTNSPPSAPSDLGIRHQILQILTARSAPASVAVLTSDCSSS